MNELKGFRQLNRRLRSLDAKLAEKVLRRGSARMAQVITKEMKQAAPRNKGNLRKSITYSNKRVRNGGYFARVGAFRTSKRSGFYAKFLEFGTKGHVIKKASVNNQFYSEVNHPGMSAQPFIKPAFERSYRRAMSDAGKLMFKLIADLK